MYHDRLQCPTNGLRKSLNGSVANVNSQQAYGVGMAGAFTVALPGNPLTFVLDQVLDGPRDLIAGRVNVVGEAFTPDRLIVRRDLNPPNGATLPVLDFSSAEAFAPALATLTLSAIPSGMVAQAVSGVSSGNQTVALLGATEFSTGPTFFLFGLPAAQLRASDLHVVTATAEAQNPPREQSIASYSHDVTSHALSFVTELPPPTVGPYTPATVTRMRAAGSIGSGGSAFGGYVEVSFIQHTRAWVMSQTRGWIGTTSNYDIRTLVLTGLSGWNEANYGVQSGSEVTWTVEARNAGNDFVPSTGALLRTLAFHGAVVP